MNNQNQIQNIIETQNLEIYNNQNIIYGPRFPDGSMDNFQSINNYNNRSYDIEYRQIFFLNYNCNE